METIILYAYSSVKCHLHRQHQHHHRGHIDIDHQLHYLGMIVEMSPILCTELPVNRWVRIPLQSKPIRMLLLLSFTARLVLLHHRSNLHIFRYSYLYIFSPVDE